jgi:hypothetical protein
MSWECSECKNAERVCKDVMIEMIVFYGEQ